LTLAHCILAEPTSPEEAKGILDVPIGDFWLKSLSIKGGICPIKNYQETLKTRIEEGAWKPSDIIDKEFKIEDAAKAYRDFADHKLIKPVFRFDHHHGN
jgi:threonine dehydrogenase-like Zn-dependent dehydrogenase